MKISAKINLGFSIFLLVPLVLTLSVVIYSYTTTLEKEAQAKLTANLKIAELLLGNEIEEFRNLAISYTQRKSLIVLLEFNLPQKIEHEFEQIRNSDHLDDMKVVSIQDESQLPRVFTQNVFSAEYAVAGLELLGSELSFVAVSPIRNRKGLLSAALLIRRRLRQTDLLETIRQETDAKVSVHIRPSGNQSSDELVGSLQIRDLEGNLLARLQLQRLPDELDVTARILLQAFWIVGFSGVVLIVLLRLLIVRTIVRPILALKQNADDIGEGRYAARITSPAGDEIGDLGRHFNAMAEQVQQALDAYKTLNDNLEQTVEERTAELQESAEQLRRTLQELGNMQTKLMARERLATLGELIAGIAHEVKNPLHLIGNFNDITSNLLDGLQKELAKDTPDPAKLKYFWETLPECAQKIRKHTERAVGTINNMLAQTRGTPGAPIPTSINWLTHEYVTLAYKASSKSMLLEEHYSSTLGAIKIPVNPHELGRAILNIALNACAELTRKANTVRADYRPVIQVSTEDEEQQAVIRIRDNGDGIPEAWQKKIFQPFFSGKAPGEGSGLGLAIAHDIVTKIHQGQLEVRSRPGEFTEFIVRLPK